jgi:hypothetical protein
VAALPGKEDMDMHTPSDDAIRDRAYALWIEAGSPEGNDLYFWYAAELELAGDEEEAPLDEMSPAETVDSGTPDQPTQH